MIRVANAHLLYPQETWSNHQRWIILRSNRLAYARHLLCVESVPADFLRCSGCRGSPQGCTCTMPEHLLRRTYPVEALKALPNPDLSQVSSMSKIRRSSALIPTPAAYVKACLARVGHSGGAAFTGRPAAATLFPTHAIIDYLLGVLSWKTAVIRYTHNLHKDIRRRALRKAEREAKKI
jgi:hypothetical protein